MGHWGKGKAWGGGGVALSIERLDQLLCKHFPQVLKCIEIPEHFDRTGFVRNVTIFTTNTISYMLNHWLCGQQI